MLNLGFFEYRLPNMLRIDQLSWTSREEYLGSLGRKYRYNLRRETLAREAEYRIRVDRHVSELEAKHRVRRHHAPNATGRSQD